MIVTEMFLKTYQQANDIMGRMSLYFLRVFISKYTNDDDILSFGAV
jgi:hypothetical protein